MLFYWDRQQTLDFYANMAEQPLDVIYLGETVCSKRRAMMLDDWLGLARDLAEASSAQLVLSGLTLVEAASELSSLRRLCDNGELLVEANDMGAVQLMSERKLPFVGGPALNLYNGHALAELVASGMSRWVPPVEASGKLIKSARAQLQELGVALPEIEIFAYGHLPLAYSARCFTARAENRPRTIASSAARTTRGHPAAQPGRRGAVHHQWHPDHVRFGQQPARRLSGAGGQRRCA